MTREEKKRYLNTYIERKRKIESLLEEHTFWESTIKSVPISRIDPTGIRSSTHKDTLTEHLDICLKIQQMEIEAEARLAEIEKLINSVSQPDQRAVLRYRYINGDYFHKIAKKMNFSLDHVYTLHRNALDSILNS